MKARGTACRPVSGHRCWCRSAGVEDPRCRGWWPRFSSLLPSAGPCSPLSSGDLEILSWVRHHPEPSILGPRRCFQGLKAFPKACPRGCHQLIVTGNMQATSGLHDNPGSTHSSLLWSPKFLSAAASLLLRAGSPVLPSLTPHECLQTETAGGRGWAGLRRSVDPHRISIPSPQETCQSITPGYCCVSPSR